MNNKFKDKYKKLICATVVYLLCAFMLVNFHTTADRFDYTFKGQTLKVSDNCTTSVDTLTGVLKITNIENGNVTIKTEGMALQPGSYKFDFQYSMQGCEKADYNFYSSSVLNSDNTTGRQLYSGQISIENEGVNGEFTTDKFLENMVFSVEIPEGAQISIGRLTINSDTVYVNDNLVTAFLAGIVYLFVAWLILRQGRQQIALTEQLSVDKSDYTLALFVIAMGMSVFLATPLFTDKITAGCDLLFHMNRIEGIANGLKTGQFPVRIHTQQLQGYGYPNSIFYPELFLYIPALIRLAGASLVASYTAFVIMVNMATVFVGYIAFSKMFSSRLAGIFAAVVYTMNPYRISVVYDRAAVGEYLAMMFIPLMAYGIYAVVFGDKKDWFWLAIAFSGIIQSHIITTVISTAFCLCVVLIGVKHLFDKEKRLFAIVKAALVTLFVNMWFIGPMLTMMLQMDVAVMGRKVDLTKNSIKNIGELMSTLYLNEFRTIVRNDAPSGLGVLFIVMLMLFVVYALLYKNRDEEKERLVKAGRFMAWTIVFTVIASTKLFPWSFVRKIPVISKLVGVLQFPSRMFGVTMMAFTVITTINIIAFFSGDKERVLAMVAVVVFMAYSCSTYMDTVNYYPRKNLVWNKFNYTLKTDINSCVGQGEYIPAASSLRDILVRADNIAAEDNIDIFNVEKNGNIITFQYTIPEYSNGEKYSVTMPLTMYPTYKAEINGVEYDTYVALGNYVRLDLTEQEGSVRVSYSKPKIFILSELITLFTFICLIVWKKLPVKFNKSVK